MIETKAKILDAAERLFAEQGFEATSLRAITTEAGTNLAAVNYHFQSKDALIDAVIGRRLAPINQKRLERLEACLVAAGDGPPSLEGIIEAFLAPVLESEGVERFRPLIGRLFATPEEFLSRVFKTHLMSVAERFRAALDLALPDLPMPEKFWRTLFMAGMMAHVLAWTHIIPAISNNLCDPTDVPALLRRLVDFTAAGFRAPYTN